MKNKQMKNNKVEHKKTLTFFDWCIRQSVRSMLIDHDPDIDGKPIHSVEDLMGVRAVCQI